MTLNRFTIALAGNANVGKSVIFNQLTGLHQHIGNWPGKTVEKAEGTLCFRDYMIDIVDLPGIYSLSTFSLEELISREYITVEKPDLVINILDASLLERNMFFTLQLLELETPMIIALNQIDIAKKKGIKIDHERLEKLLGITVVPTVAISGKGVFELIEKAIELKEKKAKIEPLKARYVKELEERIEKISVLLEKIQFKHPARWAAIKFLEGDNEVKKEVAKMSPEIASMVEKFAKEIEEIFNHPCSTVISSERYEIISKIVGEVWEITPPAKPSMAERIHALTTDRIYGYLIMAGLVFSIFYLIFTVGGYASSLLGDSLFGLKPIFESTFGTGIVGELL